MIEILAFYLDYLPEFVGTFLTFGTTGYLFSRYKYFGFMPIISFILPVSFLLQSSLNKLMSRFGDTETQMYFVGILFFVFIVGFVIGRVKGKYD